MGKETEKKLVLLVDDDEEIIVTMRAALKRLDVTIDTAGNGNQAIDKIDRTNPDLVVLDMMLPRKSGFLVMERIRQCRKKANSDKPYVIMITGNLGQRHKEYARTMGINEYLNKPFRMDRLVGIAAGLLDMKLE